MSRIRPRVGTLVAVTVATVVSLLPAVLPRTSTTQAVLTSALVATAIGIAGVLRTILRRREIDVEARWGQHRVPVLLVCGFAVTAATVNASHWQTGMHAAMGMAPAGPEYWLRAAAGTAVLAAVLVGVCRGMRWAVRKMSRSERSAPLVRELPPDVEPELPVPVEPVSVRALR